MKNYLLTLTDEQHKKIKLEATKHNVSIKQYIIAAIHFYNDSIFEKENKKRNFD